MAYATQQDMIDRRGEDSLYVAADRDGDGTLDAAAITRALDDASAEIDTYLGAAYALPLSETPPVVVNLAVDIALYRLSDRPGALTNEVRRRYEDAIALLKRIADGGATLPLSAGDAPETAKTVESSGAERKFTRDSMKGIF